MKIKDIYNSENGEKLYSIKLEKKELDKYLAWKNSNKNFQEFKDKNQTSSGLPFGFKDSQGKMVDGRIKAETKEEYDKKVKKMIEEHEKSIKK